MGSCASRILTTDSASSKREGAPKKSDRDRAVESCDPAAGEKNGAANGSTTAAGTDDGGNNTKEGESSTASTTVTLRQKKSPAGSDGGDAASSENSLRETKKVRRTSFYDTVDAAEILPHLVVGNLASSRNPDFLKGKNVAFILNLTTEGEAAGGGQRRVSELGIEHLRVQIEDDEDEDIWGHFDVCFEFINRAKPKISGGGAGDGRKRSSSTATPNRTVLVHSNYGLSRTSAIILAYLMKEKQWTLREANEHMRRCRSAAKPNDGFVVQLLRYEQELHGSMSMTLKDFYRQP